MIMNIQNRSELQTDYMAEGTGKTDGQRGR